MFHVKRWSRCVEVVNGREAAARTASPCIAVLSTPALTHTHVFPDIRPLKTSKLTLLKLTSGPVR
jgi:hypothetical protein